LDACHTLEEKFFFLVIRQDALLMAYLVFLNLKLDGKKSVNAIARAVFRLYVQCYINQ
jgi:hypothetical protein